jgi:hypothetical protein
MLLVLHLSLLQLTFHFVIFDLQELYVNFIISNANLYDFSKTIFFFSSYTIKH